MSPLTTMNSARRTSYLLFASVIVGVVALHLGPVALAGLFSYMIMDLTHRRIRGAMPELAARLVALVVFLVIAVSLSWMVAEFVRLTLARTPLILSQLLPQVDKLASEYGLDLPFENLHQFRTAILEAIKENARSITAESGLLTRGFFQLIVGIFVAILCFLSEPDASKARPNFFDAVRRELDQRVQVFMLGFEKILGAQVLISLINTFVTLVFLLAIGLPYVHFLTLATFLFGVIPIIGNIMSNCAIIGTAMTVSPRMAFAALLFLIITHKAQYFLNSRILGSRINTPMWQLLLGLLVGEAIMGVPGMVLAPAMLHYLREEMIAIPYQGKAV